MDTWNYYLANLGGTFREAFEVCLEIYLSSTGRALMWSQQRIPLQCSFYIKRNLLGTSFTQFLRLQVVSNVKDRVLLTFRLRQQHRMYSNFYSFDFNADQQRIDRLELPHLLRTIFTCSQLEAKLLASVSGWDALDTSVRYTHRLISPNLRSAFAEFCAVCLYNQFLGLQFRAGDMLLQLITSLMHLTGLE